MTRPIKKPVVLSFLAACAWLAAPAAAEAECYSGPTLVGHADNSDLYELTNNCGGDVSVHYVTETQTFGKREETAVAPKCGGVARFGFDPKYLRGDVTVEATPETLSRTCVKNASSSEDDDIARRLAAAAPRTAATQTTAARQNADFDQEAESGQRRYDEMKKEEARQAQEQQRKIDAKLTRCQEDFDQAMATCTGNTDQFRKENFVALWVDRDSRACGARASLDMRLCRAIANNRPQSEIDSITRAWAQADSDYQQLERSYGDYLPHDAGSDDDSGPSYAPAYPTQVPNVPQRRVTTAPFPQMPAVTVPSPVRPSGGFNCPYSNQACAVH